MTDIRRCPIGLDDNRKMCSAGTCDACMAERTEFFGYEPRHRREKMSNDLVARLRRVAEFGGTHMDGLWTEAADHIEQLEAEVEKWKTAFAAQTRKLQLAIGAGGPPVRDALNDFRAHAHKRRCPIGLDDNRKMCSAGTCDACMAERTEFFGYEPRHRGVDLDVPKEVWVERVTNRWSKDTYLCVHPSPVHDGMVRYVHEDFVQEKDNEQH